MAGIDNHGNFLALLNFRIEAGDTVLREHLSTTARNATYTSNTIQNEIITLLADQLTTSITDKVKAAKWFTVIADEVTDVANREQLSIVLRYVDSATLTVREDLVGFFECDTGISGCSLSEKIKRWICPPFAVKPTTGLATWQVRMVRLLSSVQSILLPPTSTVLLTA